MTSAEEEAGVLVFCLIFQGNPYELGRRANRKSVCRVVMGKLSLYARRAFAAVIC